MDTKPDPWDWTVDEVVDQFCHARTLWSEGRSGARLPDPVSLERALRENDVEGSTLLTDLGPGELKDEFGLKSLGQRSGVMWGIRQLRNRSEKYLENQRSSAHLQQVMKAESQPATPFRSFSATPGRPFSPGLPTIVDSPLPGPQKEEDSMITDKIGSSSTFFSTADVSNHLPTGSDRSSKRLSSPTQEQPDGRKKRRMTLAPPLPLPDGSTMMAQPQPQPGTSAATTTMTLMELPTRTWLSGIVSEKSSYLGPRKLTSDDIFFGSGGWSEVLNPDTDMKPLTEDGTDSSEFQICLVNGRSVPGRQRFVYDHMVHFLRQPLLGVRRHGKPAMAVFPYKHSTSTISDSRSALVFTLKNGCVRATREMAAGLSGDTTQGDPLETNSNQEWDFLLQRHGNEPTEKSPLPLYGESEADTEWSKCEKELREEDQAEGTSEARPRGQLSKEKVLDVVDEEISGYVATWEKQKLPLRKCGAWKIWKKNPIERRMTLDKERVARLHSYDRLAKLKKGIMDDIWHTAKAVRDQCKSLEQTVIQQEEAAFKMAVLQRTNPPIRPVQPIKAKKKGAKAVATNDQDDISLDSDSGVATETESLNGFMEIDEEPVAHLDLTQRYDSEESVAGRDDDDMAGDEDMVDGHAGAHSDHDSVLEAKPELGAATNGSSADTEVIDLTSDTEDKPPSPVPRPMPSPSIESRRIAKSDLQETHWGQSPLKDSDENIDKWDIDDLNEREDVKRILIKLLRTMPLEEYSELRKFSLQQTVPQLVKLVEQRIALHAKGIASHPGPLGADEILRLYLCWHERNSENFSHMFNINGTWGFKSEIQRTSVQRVRETFRKTDNKSLKDFCVFLERALEENEAPIKQQKATANNQSAKGISIDSSGNGSDSEMVADSQATPHKKRKKQIAESQSAKQLRERTRRTQIEQNERASLFLHQQSLQLAESQQIIVNPGKEENEQAIYINDYIANRIQPHQVDGVRFLWGSIVASTKKTEDLQGCLLAHTMGLGKTMQAITFLVTIAEACADAGTRSQVPESLRKQRTLIICPSSLIFNWESEFAMWDVRSACGHRWSLDANMSISSRQETVQAWYKKTGVLLVSYDFIRMIIENKARARNKSGTTAPSQYDTIKDQLLEGTSLIVADEAHAIKNLASGISKAVKLFKTTSRIALTGSPLSNNLKEYFAMIEWISPGYLGDQVEFIAHFVEPIERSNDMGSTVEERRTARRQLKTLQEILDPKIHRREVTVLKGSLKPKVEFIIKVPLTDMQFEAYCAFIKLFCRQQKGDINNTRLWSWMSKLRLLCSHPRPFWQSLVDDNNGNKSPKTPLGPDAVSTIPITKTDESFSLRLSRR